MPEKQWKVKKNLKTMELLKFNRYYRLNLLYWFLSLPWLANKIFYFLRPIYESPKENFLSRTFRYGILTVGGGLHSRDVLKGYHYGLRAILDNFKETLKVVKRGEPLVWVEWILTAEMLEAFDVHSFNSAALNIFANTRGAGYPPLLVEEAENNGIPIEFCSAMKLNAGAYMMDQLPQPDLIIAGSHPCDSNASVAQIFESITGASTFIFDVPYWKDESSYDYFEKETWNQIKFLEKHLEKKINWEKLKEELEEVNKFNFYLKEICEMNRAIPAPSSMIDLNFAWVVREINIRSPYALKMAKELYKATKKKFEKGKGVVKKENVRVLLWFPPIGFFTYIFKWMEKEFGAVVVADFIGHVSTIEIDTSTNESMVHGLAVTQMNLAMGRQCHGPAEFITDEMVQLMDDYQADCMIFNGHVGCKHGWAALKIVQDLCRERGIPVLYLDIDIMDQRHLSEQGVRDEITEFFRTHGWA